MSSYLALTNLKWREENATATWTIECRSPRTPKASLSLPMPLEIRGYTWQVRIIKNDIRSAVECLVSPINKATYNTLNQHIELIIVDTCSEKRLWSFEKTVRYEFPPLYPGFYQIVYEVLNPNLVRWMLLLPDVPKKSSLVLEFAVRDEVEKNIVEDSRLVLKQSEPKSTEVVPNNDWKELSENILSLLLKEDDCDVTLNVSGRYFKAHRNILSARSPVFDRMFKHDLKEKKTGTVDIPDCDPGAFEAYLHYLYSGNFDTTTVDNVCNLYRISDKYGSKTLVRRCLRFMMDNLSVDKFGEFVSVILNDLDASSFLEAAISFFADNLEGIGESEAWKEFLEYKPFQANDLMIKAHKNFTSRHKK